MIMRVELADIPVDQRDIAAKALDFTHYLNQGLVAGDFQAWDKSESLAIIGEILCEAGIEDWAVSYCGD